MRSAFPVADKLGYVATTNRWIVFTLAACGLLIPGPLNAQTYYEYITVFNDRLRGMITQPREIALRESGGKATLEFMANMNTCWLGPLDATVEKTAETTFITIPPKLTGCDVVRLVIKNDGSGGYRETKTGETWTRDPVDRGLRILKK